MLVAISGKKRILALSLSFLLIVTLLVPISSFAQESERKTVRVGWHEEPYFILNEYGQRSGYSYDYQSKIAACTGWDYEYVEGTWSELFQMLKDGELDLMSNVSKTDEQGGSYLCSALPMGTEAYCVFVSPENAEITSDDLSMLDGKKVGVTKDSLQKDLFLQWEAMHGIETELIEMTCTEEESIAQLGTTFDAFVSVDVYADQETAIPISRIGSSDFYFAVNNYRSDLLPELDYAMSRIQEENTYFNQQLHEQYLRNTDAENYLTSEEKNWLSDHGAIRVGYLDGFQAFCATDPNTGELTGALKDYLDYASNALGDATIDFEAVSYQTAAAAMGALQNGEIDCMVPACLTYYGCEQYGVDMSQPLMQTEMDAIVREAEQNEFTLKDGVTAALNEEDIDSEMWLLDHFPNCAVAYFDDIPASLEAVAAGVVDCVIIRNSQLQNISDQCKKLHLAIIDTDEDMDGCFALNKGETELYSILSRVVGVVSNEFDQYYLNDVMLTNDSVAAGSEDSSSHDYEPNTESTSQELSIGGIFDFLVSVEGDSAVSAWTCAACGNECDANAKFCPNCGTPKSGEKWTCPNCGISYGNDVNFCPNDGTQRP